MTHDTAAARTGSRSEVHIGRGRTARSYTVDERVVDLGDGTGSSEKQTRRKELDESHYGW